MTTESSSRRNTQSAAADQPVDAIAESKIRYLALEQLALSPDNARKTPATAAKNAELEASIRAHGIKQNLIVHRAEIDGQGIHLVDAGGRRLKILQKLAGEGVIDAKTYKVPCIVVPPENAVEISLIENTIRANMHPADEFVAMAALIDAGISIKDVVRRFGCTERHVRQRLRLGKLAPELLDAYRAGDIDSDSDRSGTRCDIGDTTLDGKMLLSNPLRRSWNVSRDEYLEQQFETYH